LLEHEYRTDPQHRILMGCSAGGLFTLYAMYTQPGPLFRLCRGGTAGSSNLVLSKRTLRAREASYPAGCYITAADYEWRDYDQNILLFNRRLQERHYPKVEAIDFGMSPACAILGSDSKVMHAGWSTSASRSPRRPDPRASTGFQALAAPGASTRSPSRTDDSESERMKYSEVQNGILKQHREWLERLVSGAKVLKATTSADGSKQRLLGHNLSGVQARRRLLKWPNPTRLSLRGSCASTSLAFRPDLA
jgi:hypothetical protein